jgi:endoglycosylceramidase
MVLILPTFTHSFSIDSRSQQIIDECSRARLFHGVNAVEKLPPYLPALESSTGELYDPNVLGVSDAELLQSWGMNVVRLGVLWAGVMPEEGVVNMTYLADVKTMIETLASKGIYTLVDAHQDVMSWNMCGEGMPDWAFFKALNLVGFNFSDPSKTFPKPLPYDIPLDDNGRPNVTVCMENGFFLYYMSYESEALWHAIYSEPEIWDDFAVSFPHITILTSEIEESEI